MAGSFKHRHQTAIATSGADVDANEWNDSLVMAGGSDGQFAQRDSSQPDGWRLANATTFATFASRAAADGKQGLHIPNDGFCIGRDNGASFDTFGPNFPFTAPSDGSFSWDNQGTSTLATTKDSLQLIGTAVANVQNLVCRYHTAPATPWTATWYLEGFAFNKGNSFGVLFRESSTGKIHVFDWLAVNASVSQLRSTKYTNSTTFSADYQALNCNERPKFFQISDDGANRICCVSADGQNWIVVHTITRLDFLTVNGGDQYGFHVNTQNASTPNMNVALTVLSLKLS